jgi:hypothetical protein
MARIEVRTWNSPQGRGRNHRSSWTGSTPCGPGDCRGLAAAGAYEGSSTPAASGQPPHMSKKHAFFGPPPSLCTRNVTTLIGRSQAVCDRLGECGVRCVGSLARTCLPDVTLRAVSGCSRPM